MNRLFRILTLLSAVAFLYSCQDEIDQEALSDFGPGVISVIPAANSTVVQGQFDAIKGYFADGSTSPLDKVTVLLTNGNGDEVVNVTEDLSGTQDSVIIEGTTFDANDLDLGIYTLKVTITDSKGQNTDVEYTFEISDLPFPANNKEMYIAGSFNGWGFDAMELTGPNTWEIKEIDLQGGEWKFKNTVDWTDQDWGDGGCDGKMENTTGGGANTNCGFTGLVNVTFNDETLNYSVVPSVDIEQTLSSLYLHGNINNFEGEDYEFNLVENNTWVLDEILLNPGDVYRFSEGAFSMGKVFGDNEPDSIADEFGKNIVVPGSVEKAIYKITFNDNTFEYSIDFVKQLFPENLFLVGGSTSAGWDPASSVPFVKRGDGQFEIYAYLEVAGDGFKFLPTQDNFDGDWGMQNGNEGTLEQDGESNVTVDTDDFYRIYIDFNEGTYSVDVMAFGLIGSATKDITGGDGWGADIDMTFSGGKGDYEWTLSGVTLVDGEIQFRANDAWDINFGGADGNLEFKGGNVSVSAGTYDVSMVLDPINGFTYSFTLL